MSIVKSLNKKTGITYVYESESYWDYEKKQPRNRRKLVGKLDEKGEIIPTGKRGPKPVEKIPLTDPEKKEYRKIIEASEIYQSELIEARNEITALKEEIRRLKKEKQEILEGLQSIVEKYKE